MSNTQQQYIIPHIRTFKIDNIPRVKISLFNEKSKLEINRIFMPIESTLSSQEIFKNQNNNIQTIDSFKNVLSKQDIKTSTIDIASSSKTQQITNTIDHQESVTVAYNHEQHRLPSSDIIQEQQVSIVPRNFIDEQHQPNSSKVPIKNLIISTNKTDILSTVTRVEQQSLSPPLSQLIPDSIINDKQATNRIFNEKNSTYFTHPSKFITLTSINSSQKNRYYQIGNIFTSASTFIMHQNELIAHATTSDPFLSDTIFIILIAILAIIILLFCFGLFCLCRRTTKRNISPSFDGASYIGLNEHSFEIPMDNYQQKISKYENDIPYINNISSLSTQTRSSINHPILTNDGILLPQHHKIKQKVSINKNKLKRKRIGFCCCNSKQTRSTKINARTRIKENKI